MHAMFFFPGDTKSNKIFKIDDTLIITIFNTKLGDIFWDCHLSFSQMIILKYFAPLLFESQE